MTSCILNPIIVLIFCLVIIDGGVVDRNTCDVIDPSSCDCFQPHVLQCKLNSSSHLQIVLSSLNQNVQVIQFVKLLDLTVDKLTQIPSGLFSNLTISGLLVKHILKLPCFKGWRLRVLYIIFYMGHQTIFF